MNYTNILKFSKIIFFTLIVSVVAYGSYKKLKNDPLENRRTTRHEKVEALDQDKVLKDSIVAYGMKLLGTSYVSGGCSKDGFDCSGFVNFVFQHFDITVPRSSADFEHFGKEIPIEQVAKGDLLLFLSPTRNVIGHIGIVSKAQGKKSDFIHASSSREMKVIITNLSNEGYTRRFVKAIRVL
ncbi:MAG TPA: C40 family peptidase [Flavobacterium sp.]|jgi:cell wall-associated NlpC family hydrolase